MWDTVQINEVHLSHAMPCQRCGHEIHIFLSCDGCDCQPTAAPDAVAYPLALAS